MSHRVLLSEDTDCPATCLIRHSPGKPLSFAQTIASWNHTAPVQKLPLLLYLLLLPTTLLAQSYLTHTYTELDGLPANHVHSITQDQEGAIWVATRNGIAWHDGVTWRQPDRDHRPSGRDFRFIKADYSGRIWVVEGNGDVAFLQDGIWNQLPPPPLSKLHSGDWAGFDVLEGSDEYILAAATKRDGLLVYRGYNWYHLTRLTGLPSDTINDAVFYNGRLLLATMAGIAEFDTQLFESKTSLSSLQLPGKVVRKLAIEYQSAPDLRSKPEVKRLWLFGDDWMGKFEEDRFIQCEGYVPIGGPQKRFSVFCSQPDYVGGIIYGNENVLYHQDIFLNTYLLSERGVFTSKGTTSCFIDRDYCLWVAGVRGVTKIPSFKFINYDHKDGMLEDEVTSILQIDEGRYLIGHNTGYSIFDRGNFIARHFKNPPQPPNQVTRVLDMVRATETQFWLAVTAAGMYKLDLEGEDRWYQSGFNDRRTSSGLLITEDQTLFVAGGEGLYYYDTITDSFKQSEVLFEFQEYIRTITQDKRGRILLGTGEDGVIVLENKTWKQYRSESHLDANHVFSITPFDDNHVLIGTLSGVYTLDDNGLHRFSDSDPYQDRPIYFIGRDKDENLWFGTDNGVFVYDGEFHTHYTRIHGLVGLETNRRAFLADQAGHVWIGTSSGLSCYRRAYDLTAQIPLPEIRLIDLRVGEKQLDPAQQHSLPARENTFDYHFRFFSFIDEKANLLRYLLEGADKEWSEPEIITSNHLKFHNLPAGKYRLHVQAANAHGIWSDVQTSETVRILPPFWLTWWFWFLVAGSLLGASVLVFRLFVQQKYALRLKHEVREMTIELSTHHDKLESTVQQRTRELSTTNETLRTEINRREAMQRELERHHAHLESVFHGVHDAIVTIDSQGVITRANQGFAQLVGLEGRKVEGRRLTDILALQPVIEAVREGQEVRGWHVEASDRARGELLLKVNAQPLDLGGTAGRVVMIMISDVTRLYRLQKEVEDRKHYRSIIGGNPQMQAIYALIEDMSNTLATVLITGESGTGKELVAAALHNSSARAGGPFIALNCAALSATILESELFGHVKGAFTGAVSERVGRFEAARGGTLFLDEIGDMPLDMQVKLLRVLETGEFERVGDSLTLSTDARIISATNQDLKQRVKEGLFRKDLYYRLNVIRIHLPPLRDRMEDIPLLVEHFIGIYGGEATPPVTTITPEALELLLGYDWPGNVRELKHLIQRATLLCRESELQPWHLRDLVRSLSGQPGMAAPTGGMNRPRTTHPAAESQHIIGRAKDHEKLTAGRLTQALAENDWNIQKTARQLGISRPTVYRKIREYDLTKP